MSIESQLLTAILAKLGQIHDSIVCVIPPPPPAEPPPPPAPTPRPRRRAKKEK